MIKTTPYINELKKDETLKRVFLVTYKEVKTTKKNEPYLEMEFFDKTGRIAAKMWNDKDDKVRVTDKLFSKNDFILVEGVTNEYQNKLQVIVNSAEKVDNEKVDYSEFTQQTKQDIELLYIQLKEKMDLIKDPYLSKLVFSFLDDKDFLTAFKKSSASIKFHQAYVGGLLEHTVKLLSLTNDLFVSYPALNRDLLLAGIFLHDIGKVKEYQIHIKPEHTDEGRLIGHTVLGILMIEEKIKKIKDFPAELTMQIRHLIASHHGEKIYGAPVLPMIAEAIALHFLDNLDASLADYYRSVDALPEDAKWTNWIESMERRLYKNKPQE